MRWIARFLGNPHAYMPCSLTPVEFQYQAISVFQYCLPLFIRRRLPRCGHFGALSHGLYTRCLRFAVPVTRAPRKTRYRWMAGPCRTGLVPAGFLTPFHDGLRRQFQATKLCLAHINLSPCALYRWFCAVNRDERSMVSNNSGNQYSSI